MKRKVLMMIFAVSLALAGCSGGKDDAKPVRATFLRAGGGTCRDTGAGTGS